MLLSDSKKHREGSQKGVAFIRSGSPTRPPQATSTPSSALCCYTRGAFAWPPVASPGRVKLGSWRPCTGGWLSNWRPSTEHELGKWAAPPTGVLLLPSLPGPPRKLGIFPGFSHTAPRTRFYLAAGDCAPVSEQDQSESSGLHSLQTHRSTRVLWTQNQEGQMP